MRAIPLVVLGFLAAASTPAYAQDETNNVAREVLVEELAEQVIEETTDVTDDVTEDVADSEEPTIPSLAEIAASDPSLSIREGENGEADAMIMLSDVLFGFGNDALEPEMLNVLSSIAAQLEGVPGIRIKGHTDAIGDEESNRRLGQLRANNVRDWLVANTNLTSDMIVPVGVGEADPIAENLTEDGGDNPDGRARNRRVEFILLGALGRS